MHSPANAGSSSSIGEGTDDYVGIEKLSHIIERSYPTTLKMVQSDKITGTRHGVEWRIKLIEVRRYLEHGNNKNPQPQTKG